MAVIPQRTLSNTSGDLKWASILFKGSCLYSYQNQFRTFGANTEGIIIITIDKAKNKRFSSNKNCSRYIYKYGYLSLTIYF